MGPTQRPEREADHSPPSSAEVNECWELYLYAPTTPSWNVTHLKKHRDNFTYIIDVSLIGQTRGKINRL